MNLAKLRKKYGSVLYAKRENEVAVVVVLIFQAAWRNE
jgi:hypothetical protein